VLRRKIRIIAFQRERIVARTPAPGCTICHNETEWFTTAQAADSLQVNASTIRRWLAQEKVHGIRTAGGQFRVCRHSLYTEVNRDETN
jgi:excisionase family DNA binding protein